jgi:hypothetical protein
MRVRTILLALAFTLTGCGPEEAPINRIILPAPIPAAAENDADMLPFEAVYLNREAHVALFFIGDAKSMSAHFVDAKGLADQTKLLSQEQLAALGDKDPTREASIGANNILTLTGLPDRGFQVIPVQDGYLLQYSYGKLHYLSFLTLREGKLHLGLGADMTLLARLAQGAGAADALVSMPAIGDGKGKGGRYVYFASAPPALASAITGNAAAIYREVSTAESKWEQIDIAAPKTLSDTATLTAIQARVGAAAPAGPTDPASIDNGSMAEAPLADNSTEVTQE